MAKIPYQCLQVCGEVLLAARGANIHTFGLGDGSYISTWKYPQSVSAETTDGPGLVEKTGDGNTEASPGPPKKKMRLGESPEEQPETPEGGEGGRRRRRAQKMGDKKGGSQGPTPGLAECPIVISLESTSDGQHVVAVTGQDKTVWTFEHDGKGKLEQLSERMMPKRPCSIAITPDNQTIISADKFGDVYSLPLIPSEAPGPEREEQQQQQQQQTEISLPPEPKPFKPQASELTVHTKRNLRALESQLKHRQDHTAQNKKAEAAAPPVEHALLLGHVSMLTAVALAPRPQKGDGSYYIVTADRDEHIRVSRGPPQAHVIEGYCLGHEEFVSSVCLPVTRPRLLVSGGGDAELFVWDWAAGRLLSRADVLGPAKEVVAGAEKVAVTGLWAHEEDAADVCWVVVIAERVPALFFYHLSPDGTLVQVQTVGLPGNPLDVALPRQAGGPALLVAVDLNAGGGGAASSVMAFDLLSGERRRWQQRQSFSLQDSSLDDGSTADVGAEELGKLLYTTENLRKADTEEYSAVAAATVEA